MPRTRVTAALFLTLALCSARAAAQGAPVAAPVTSDKASPAAATRPAAAETIPAAPDLLRDTLLIELSTAGFYELAARSRELGLADTGGVEELRSRLYQHFGLKVPVAEAAKGRTVTIEKAGRASYAKVEDGEGGIVRASGGVVLTLVEANGDSHRIQAGSIAYNRARATVSAKGSVRYERRSGSSSDVFSGEVLSADLNDWSGVFVDGKIRRAGGQSAPGERGLVISADTIVRRSADVMVLKDGVISSCDADDPHYAVRAGRVWLLGDKEWAVSNAVFSLGDVPILWLPFFYYPGDELVFHPVIGYRSREGRFLQTTVYLIGAKPPKPNTTSILSLQDSGPAKPTQLKGLFLRHVAGPAPKDEGSLKTMADLYSGLGAFAGIQGSLPKLGFLDKTDLYLGLGISRSLFPVGYGVYSPYVEAGDWSSIWNQSYFFNTTLPFRYAFDLSTSMRKGGVTASLSLPLYSDPYFDQDFRNRSEDMDWFKLLGTGTDTSTVPSLRTQLAPRLDTSFSIMPKGLSPWVSSMDITHLGTSMTLLSKVAALPMDSYLGSYDPRQQFFYPSVFRPVDLTATFRGTLLGTPAPSAVPAASAAASPAAAPVVLRSPWEQPSAAAEGAEPAAAGSQDAAKAATAPVTDFRLPQRAPDAPPARFPSWTKSLGWSLSPSMFMEDRYRSDAWNDPSDIDYSLLYSLYSYRLSGALDASVAYGDTLSTSLSLSYADQNQFRPVLNTDPGSAASYALADNLFRNRRVGESAKLTYKPFASSWLWSGTSLSWGMDSTLYGLKYDSATSAFKEDWLAWDPAIITAHNVSMVLAARPDNLVQSISLTASLPPLLDSYSGGLSLDAGLAALRVQSRMYRKYKGADYSFDPITASLSMGRVPGPVLTDSFVYDASGIGPVSNQASLSYGFFSSSFTARRTRSYMPVVGYGWVAYGEEAFAPSDLSLALNPLWKSDPTVTASGATTWSLGSNLAFSQSLVRFSEANLVFGLTASIKVGDKTSVSVSSQSQNSAVWRYYSDLFAKQLESGGFSAQGFHVDPLTDIWNSLMIWDNATLRKSLFKLRSLSVRAARDLHDWTLSAEVSTKPLYDASSRIYSLDTSISVLLAWKDISDIKSTVKKDSTGITY